jgi:hypothetical protein
MFESAEARKTEITSALLEKASPRSKKKKKHFIYFHFAYSQVKQMGIHF